MNLKELEKKYYLCEPLTKREWQDLAMFWGGKLKTLEEAIKQRYAIMKEQNICIDCFKDVPQLASLCVDSTKENQK